MKHTTVSSLAKLTPAQVRQVRQWYAQGLTQLAIAKKLSISQVTVSNLLRGRVYAKIS